MLPGLCQGHESLLREMTLPLLIAVAGMFFDNKIRLPGAYMIFFAILLKSVVWAIAFRSALRSDLRGMLLRAAAVTIFLTAVDKMSVASNLAVSAILLTLILYALMSFTLMPVAWKLKKGWVSAACNAIGILGALAGVNFTMDLLRGLLPFLNR